MDSVGGGTRLLLERLLWAERPLTSANIAEETGITRRMVRNRLKEAEVWLRLHGSELKSRRGVGVWVSYGRKDRTALLNELAGLDTYQVRMRSPTRRRLIALSLLWAGEMTVDAIAERLFTSRSTVLRDLERLEQRFSPCGIRISKTLSGIRIEGKEAALRRMIVEAAAPAEGMPETYWRFSETPKPPEDRIPAHPMGLLLSLFGPEVLARCTESVKEAESRLGRRLSDLGRKRLVVHLAVALERIAAGKSVIPEFSDALLDTKEFAISKRILTDLFPDNPPADSESAFFACHLLGAQYLDMGEPTRKNPEIGEAVESMVETAEKFLGRSLASDRMFVDGLTNHLEAAHYRIKYGLRLLNPLIDEIQKNYPHYFLVASAMAEDFNRALALRLPESEVTYVAMHLGASMERLGATVKPQKVVVVCPTGLATTNLLVSRIKAYFPWLSVVATASISDVRSHLSGADLVISTAPLDGLGIPVVTVSPIFGNKDAAYIGSRLIESDGFRGANKPGSEPRGEAPAGSLLRAIVAIDLDYAANDWEEAVFRAGGLLVSNGCATHDYVSAMVSWIKKLGGYVVLGNGLAIPHAPFAEGGIKQGFALVRLGRPVVFPGRENEPVDIIVGFVAPLGDDSREVLEDLNRLNDRPDRIEALRQAADSAQVLAVLERLSIS